MASMYTSPNNSVYMAEAPGMPPPVDPYAYDPAVLTSPRSPVPAFAYAQPAPSGYGSPSVLSRSSSNRVMSPRASLYDVDISDRRRRDSSIQPSLPYTKEFVDEYRKRMKNDPDPEAQFAFAMYLIDAAKRVADPVSYTHLRAHET